MKKIYFIMALACMMMVSCGSKEGDGKTDGHEYVDLGLPSGLKWATCNVGAKSSEKYGDYFAWGETETKETYDDESCLNYGNSMPDFSGNVEYDAATAHWGETWRTPKAIEWKELLDECTWEWTTQKEVNGYKVTGPNGRNIFLPATGGRIGIGLYGDGDSAYYWSSTQSGGYDGDSYAYYLGFGANIKEMLLHFFCVGCSIRPVTDVVE